MFIVHEVETSECSLFKWKTLRALRLSVSVSGCALQSLLQRGTIDTRTGTHMNVMAALRADGQTARTDKLEVRGGFVKPSHHLDQFWQLPYDEKADTGKGNTA